MSIDIAIVGKPNVGKSTFFNKIFGSNISKVADEPGTTKQVISKSFNFGDNELVFHDTGGLKKKAKSKDENQSYITKECLSAINKSSIIIFMMDANDKFTKNDKQICRMILNKLKTLIVIINKADLIKDEIKTRTKYFNYYFENLFSDILIKPHFFSSMMEKSPEIFIKKICSLDASTKLMIDNKKLNFFLEKTNNSHRAPQKGNFRPKIKFLRQVNSKPIILKAFGTRLKGINKDYKNFFLKQFLSYFGIYNKVAIIKFVNNDNPFDKN
jgi:GTP-binding protein